MSDFSRLKADLLARRGELEIRLAKIKKDISQPLNQDSAEQAIELENEEVLGAIGREVEDEINKINRALIRIDEGVYGECLDCGNPIPEARLRVRPYSSRCIECAEKAEKAH
ncbi:MAG: hypothetical protein CSA50_01410 [Gammaproteobacteria bacterium]|nr:MAG: hypothetical protein CSA50_01410 [Gammaproteobacteria bacterium]